MRFVNREITQSDADRLGSDLTERALRMSKKCLGLQFAVGTKRNLVRGVIVEATPRTIEVAWSPAEARARCLWDIVMECGVARVRRSFTVASLPQPR